MGVASGDQPLNSPQSDTCFAPRSRRTKVTLTLGGAGGIGASATAAAFPGDCVGSHWMGSVSWLRCRSGRSVGRGCLHWSRLNLSGWRLGGLRCPLRGCRGRPQSGQRRQWRRGHRCRGRIQVRRRGWCRRFQSFGSHRRRFLQPLPLTVEFVWFRRIGSVRRLRPRFRSELLRRFL